MSTNKHNIAKAPAYSVSNQVQKSCCCCCYYYYYHYYY